MNRTDIMRATHPVSNVGRDDVFRAAPRQGSIARSATLFAYAGLGWLALVGIVFLLSSSF